MGPPSSWWGEVSAQAVISACMKPGTKRSFYHRNLWWVVALGMIAEQHGFSLVSREYRGSKEKYIWCCFKGHEWLSRYDGIIAGKGCPVCFKATLLSPSERVSRKRQRDKAYAEKNKVEKAKYDRQRRLEKLEELRANDKERYRCDPEKYKARVRRYQQENRDKVNKYSRERYRSDPVHKLKVTLRNRINKAIFHCFKSGSHVRDLGCSVEQLMSHLEARFLPGMTWENHGKWHIDHIKPLASFDLTQRDQFLQAAHYTNLQPLWGPDNLKKGARVL